MKFKRLIVVAMFVSLVTILAVIASEAAGAAEPPPSSAGGSTANERAYFEKVKQARESRDRDIEDRKQPLVARRAELQRDLEVAKKGAVLTEFRKRLADGSVMLDDGRIVTVLTERLGTELRLSFCDQDHKDAYIRQKNAELTTLVTGVARLDDEKKARVAVPLNLEKLAPGDVGDLDSSGEAVVDVIKVIDNSDMLVNLQATDRPKTTLWISRNPTGGLKEKSRIMLTGPFAVVGTHDNPSAPPRTVFELRPLQLSAASQPQKR
jgi:hypothetical protein